MTAYIFAGVLIGISFFVVNTAVGYFGNLNNWQPWLAAVVPSMIYSLIALLGFSWLVVFAAIGRLTTAEKRASETGFIAVASILAVASGLGPDTILLILTIYRDATGRQFTPLNAAGMIAEASGALGLEFMERGESRRRERGWKTRRMPDRLQRSFRDQLMGDRGAGRAGMCTHAHRKGWA